MTAVAVDRRAFPLRPRSQSDVPPPRRAEPKGRRRSLTDAADLDTLVLKNLSTSVTPVEVWGLLLERGVCPIDNGIHFHRDAAGNFRGTAFVKYANPREVGEAVQKLGGTMEIGGRKVRVEIQRKGRDSRVGVESELAPGSVSLVQSLVLAFLHSDHVEVHLPGHLDPKMRKYAHSLAERHGLAHITHPGAGSEKCVYLSKVRPENTRRSGFDTSPTLSSFDSLGYDTSPSVGSTLDVDYAYYPQQALLPPARDDSNAYQPPQRPWAYDVNDRFDAGPGLEDVWGGSLNLFTPLCKSGTPLALHA